MDSSATAASAAASQPPVRSPQQLEVERTLIQSQSVNRAERQLAEQLLASAEKESYAQYVSSLAVELSYSEGQESVRQLAGLLLKNAVSFPKGGSLDKAKREKWIALPPEIAASIRRCVLSALFSPVDGARSAAAQVVAKLARVDLPSERWPDLLPGLMNAATRTPAAAPGADAAAAALQQRSVAQTLGFLCEDMYLLSSEVGQDLLSSEQRNMILSTVTHCARLPDLKVSLAGFKALMQALLFARSNMENKNEQQFLMGTVAAGLHSPDLQVARAAWDCVIQIATEYYMCLDDYVRDLGSFSMETIAAATKAAAANEGVIPEERESVALAALEFWNSLCDVELYYAEEKMQSKRYIEQAQGVLLDLLLNSLTCKNPDADAYEDDEWTLAMAAATCFTSCAQLLGASVMAGSLEFMTVNFNAPDWRGREAAVLVYGCIMEVSPTPAIEQLVTQSFRQLTAKLRDPSVPVRSTAMWALGKVVPKYPQCVDGRLPETAEIVAEITRAVAEETPAVAAYACFAVHELAKLWQDVGDRITEAPLKDLLAVTYALLNAVRRGDSASSSLRASAIEALSEIAADAPESKESNEVFKSLAETLQAGLAEATANPSGTPQIEEILSQLCNCLNVILNRLSCPDINGARLMENFFAVFQVARTRPLPPGVTEEVRQPLDCEEDALNALGTLFRKAKPPQLQERLPLLTQILLSGLKNPEATQFCRTCVGLVSELACLLDANSNTQAAGLDRAIKQNTLPELLPVLISLLQSPDTDIGLKPTLIGAIGDCAVGMEVEFLPFLPSYLTLLDLAASTKLSDGPEDPEWVEYYQNLRDAVLEAYACLLHALRNHPTALGQLQARLPTWLQYLESVLTDENAASRSNVRRVIDVVLDLVLVFREEIAKVLRTSMISKHLKAAAAKHDFVDYLATLDAVSTLR